MIEFLVAKISKSRRMVRLFRSLINSVPLFAAVTKALLIGTLPENRWPFNNREEEIFKLLSRTHNEIRS